MAPDEFVRAVPGNLRKALIDVREPPADVEGGDTVRDALHDAIAKLDGVPKLYLRTLPIAQIADDADAAAARTRDAVLLIEVRRFMRGIGEFRLVDVQIKHRTPHELPDAQFITLERASFRSNNYSLTVDGEQQKREMICRRTRRIFLRGRGRLTVRRPVVRAGRRHRSASVLQKETADRRCERRHGDGGDRRRALRQVLRARFHKRRRAQPERIESTLDPRAEVASP
jgi:hypothetical protein